MISGLLMFQLPCVLENSHNFTQLKNLYLELFFHFDIESLSLVKFLGATPFIEKLEMHVSSRMLLFVVPNRHLIHFIY